MPNIHVEDHFVSKVIVRTHTHTDTHTNSGLTALLGPLNDR